MEWKAKWIWDDSGLHPRNYWVCFRRCFEAPVDIDDAILHITADSRYAVYVNSQRLGFGPVRSWPFEQSFDSYSVKDYLKPGVNVIAVLVTHYGVGTFQYIEGRGGLLAQLDFYRNEQLSGSLCTDDEWRTAPHVGYKKESVRISC